MELSDKQKALLWDSTEKAFREAVNEKHFVTMFVEIWKNRHGKAIIKEFIDAKKLKSIWKESDQFKKQYPLTPSESFKTLTGGLSPTGIRNKNHDQKDSQ